MTLLNVTTTNITNSAHACMINAIKTKIYFTNINSPPLCMSHNRRKYIRQL